MRDIKGLGPIKTSISGGSSNIEGAGAGIKKKGPYVAIEGAGEGISGGEDFIEQDV